MPHTLDLENKKDAPKTYLGGDDLLFMVLEVLLSLSQLFNPLNINKMHIQLYHTQTHKIEV
jgi:hypothetical protein